MSKAVTIRNKTVCYEGNGYETYEHGLNPDTIADIEEAIDKGYTAGELIPGRWWIEQTVYTYLVINLNKTKVTERYRLFLDPNDAIAYANSLGWADNSLSGSLVDDELKPKVKFIVSAGAECDLEFIMLEVNTKEK